MDPATQASASDNAGLRAEILGLYGDLLIRKGEYDPALDRYKEKVSLLEEKGDWDGVVSTLLKIGHTFRLLDDSNRASEHYRKALALGRQHSLRRRIGESLFQLAMHNFYQKEMEQALEYFQSAVSELSATEDSVLLGRILMHMGNYHRKDGTNKKAEQSYAEAVRLMRQSGDEYNLGLTIANQALLSFSQDDEETGKTLIQEAFEKLFFSGAGPEIQLFKTTLKDVYGVTL